MPLQCEVWRVDLQLEAVADDGLVLDAQGGGDGVEIGFEARIVLVPHDRGQDARRRGREKRSRCTLPLSSEGRLEGRALCIQLGLADVADGADAFGQITDVADRLARGNHPHTLFLELRITLDVREQRPVALPTDAAEAAP